ncbi:hypothetical protein [Flavobacterium difficile]|uniref:YcxB-like protein domain-containing protein n=1 Tax=Flavobacterium difficile TaxID=2709659 RepID=A0ABX0I666_9FLAO|nr:hypothetical protein [Flavobacterium difficile]NHM02617.1 hypothetical protein [Flavobacterium difficile]
MIQNPELENLINKQSKQSSKVIDFIFSSPYFVRSTEYDAIIKKYEEEIIFTNKDSNKFIYFVLTFITLIIGFKAIDDESNRYLFFIFLGIIVVVFWYNSTRKLNEIKISEKGIEIEETNYLWDQIYDYGFTIVPKHNTSDYYLEIFMQTGVKLSFGLYHFTEPDAIIETMNFFRNRYSSKFVSTNS